MLNTVAGKLSVGLLALGVMSMSAASYRFSLHQDVSVNGKALKSGDYKLEVKDNTAVLKRGKETVEVPVRTETASSKFNTTQVRYTDTNQLEEIRIGGTTTKLVFTGNGPARNGRLVVINS
jgi:hypothetical protein